MKVMQINCVYDYGSTGHIVSELHKKLPNYGIESVVCYGRGKRVKERNVIKTSTEMYSKMNNGLSRLTGLMYGGCSLSTAYLKRTILKENPDIVHLQCINGFFVNIYDLIRWLKAHNYKTLLTLHAEFMYTANCSHALDCDKWISGCGDCPRLKKETGSMLFDRTRRSWSLMKEAFDRFTSCKIVSVSPWVEKRVKRSPILNKLEEQVVYNGINSRIFRRYNSNILKEKYKIESTKIILHVTPYFSDSEASIKGGKYVLELANRLKHENVKIVVVGRYKQDMLYPDNVIPIGYVSDQVELAKLYAEADLTLITSQRETFSMVTVESLCCGTPVAGFLCGGPELIALPDYSLFVEYGNIDKLQIAVASFLRNDKDSNKISKEALEEYSIETMVSKYINIYKSM